MVQLQNVGSQTLYDVAGIQRNAIFNGSLRLAQMGASKTGLVHLDKCCDRFVFGNNGGTGTSVWDFLQDSDTPDREVNHSIKLTCTTSEASPGSTTERHIRYAIEGSDFVLLRDKTCTLSFWAKSNVTGVFSVAFVNSGRDRTFISEYTISQANTWTFVAVTLTFNETGGTWDYGSGQGIGIRWALLAGSSLKAAAGSWQTGNYVASNNQVNLGATVGNYLSIAKVQMNVGAFALDFYSRSFVEDYLYCQRYLKVFDYTSMQRTPVSSVTVPTITLINIPLQTRMRTSPTVSFVGNRGTDWILRDGADSNITTGTLQSTPNVGRDFGIVRFESGTFTPGALYHVVMVNSTARLIFDAEL